LIGKKEEGGFTLIELLVVIIIIGILAAIALPSFLNQANKARQSEAKTYIGSMNRAQQAYYLEKSAFANNAAFTQLGLGIQTQTDTYDYAIAPLGTGTVTQYAQPKTADAAIKGYSGGVSIGTIGGANSLSTDSTTLAILCEANASPVQGGAQTAAALIAGIGFAAAPANTPTCTPGTSPAGFVKL
jgi:prepilin-type N-terminal cleavage/methylation domain-containing protein